MFRCGKLETKLSCDGNYNYAAIILHMAHADHARPPGDNDQAGARVSARGQEAADILERGGEGREAHLGGVTS